MAKTLHFGSFDKYKRWLAAGHIHNLLRHHGGKGTPTIKIQGKLYKPSHSNPAELVIFGNPSRRKKRSGNNHAAGCSCPICKNMRATGVSNPRRNSKVIAREKGKEPYAISRDLSRRDAKQFATELRGVAKRGRTGTKYSVRNRRRNQESGEDMTQAVELYEAFQGKDADKVIERSISDEMRHNYVALGKLVAVGTGECNVSANRLVKEYDSQPRIDFEGDGVILACSPDGAQLYFIGGRQNLDTAALKRLADDASKDIFDLGECGWVVYSAAKAPDYQTTSYVHKFGEESASSAVPRLIYDGIRKQFFLAGGEYHVDAPGIIN